MNNDKQRHLVTTQVYIGVSWWSLPISLLIIKQAGKQRVHLSDGKVTWNQKPGLRWRHECVKTDNQSSHPRHVFRFALAGLTFECCSVQKNNREQKLHCWEGTEGNAVIITRSHTRHALPSLPPPIPPVLLINWNTERSGAKSNCQSSSSGIWIPTCPEKLSDSAFVGIFHESAPRKAPISRPGHRSSAFQGDMIETSHNTLGQVGELERCIILPTGWARETRNSPHVGSLCPDPVDEVTAAGGG